MFGPGICSFQQLSLAVLRERTLRNGNLELAASNVLVHEQHAETVDTTDCHGVLTYR